MPKEEDVTGIMISVVAVVTPLSVLGTVHQRIIDLVNIGQIHVQVVETLDLLIANHLMKGVDGLIVAITGTTIR